MIEVFYTEEMEIELILEADKQPYDQLEEERILKVSPVATSLNFLFFIAAIVWLLIMFIVYSFNPFSFPQWSIVLFIGMVLIWIGVYMILLEKNARLIYGLEGFTIIDAFHHKKTCLWKDVRLIRPNGEKSIILLLHNTNTYIEVKRYYRGFHHFVQAMGKGCELDTSELIIEIIEE